MVPTGIKYMYSLMLLCICVCLYTHVSQYRHIYILHMFHVLCLLCDLHIARLVNFLFSWKTEVVLYVFIFFSPSLVQALAGCRTQKQEIVNRQKHSLFTSCKQLDLCSPELPFCTILQLGNLFMDKGIKQHITDGRYVHTNCNDQESSVLINAISEAYGLLPAFTFILQLAGILERFC